MALKDAIRSFLQEWRNRDVTVPKNFQITGTAIGDAASTLAGELIRVIGSPDGKGVNVNIRCFRYYWFTTPYASISLRDKDYSKFGINPGMLFAQDGQSIIITLGYSASDTKLTSSEYRRNYKAINETIIKPAFDLSRIRDAAGWTEGDINIQGQEDNYKDSYRQSVLFYKYYDIDNLPDDDSFTSDYSLVFEARAAMSPTLTESIVKWNEILQNIQLSFSKTEQQQFWVWKHTYNGVGDKWRDLVNQCLENKYVMMQYEAGFQKNNDGRPVTNHWNLVKNIKEGDIIFLRGTDYVYAYGMVIPPRKPATRTMSIDDNLGGRNFDSGNCHDVIHFTDLPFYEDLSEGQENWGQRVDVDEWKYILPLDKGILATVDECYETFAQNAMRRLKKEFGPVFIQNIQRQYKEIEMATNIEKHGQTVAMGLSILEGNNSLILTGAPGTGKTYSARSIAALKIGCDIKKLDESVQFQSVQFHPGYDYADFIVGLKPILINEEGKKVSESQAVGKVSVSFEWKSGTFKEFAQKALDAYKKAEENGENPPSYVMLIDEINRADLSRVFGEVFSLLEKDYRYPSRKEGITLPSSENFILPENLYILATMNDIDRSVESMDFALRRRFSWHEVKTVDSECIIDAKNGTGAFVIPEGIVRNELKAKMTAINKFIGSWYKKNDVKHEAPQPAKELGDKKFKLNLGDEYQIGGSYFLNYAKYAVAQYEALWNNHLKIILAEYLRGNKQKNEILMALKLEYDTATDATRE